MKNLFLFFLSLMVVLSGFVAQADQQIEFDLMHTVQDCKHEGRQKTFCDAKTDSNAMTEKSGMVAKINAQLDRALLNKDKSEVFIAYFSMSNKRVHEKICELIAAGVKVEIFLDEGSSTNISDLELNPKCANKDLKSLTYTFLGGSTSGDSWRLHHNKFLYVNPGNGEKININFSSGNLSSFGTSLHLDHWVTMLAPENSNLSKAYQCVMQGLRKARDLKRNQVSSDSKIVSSYISGRDDCYKTKNVLAQNDVETAIKSEKIAPVFTPNLDSVAYNIFSKELSKIRDRGYIYIGIQHFLHYGIKKDLIAAAKSGVDVRIIMDDDVVAEKGEVTGVLDFLKDLQTSAPQIQVRYIETNHEAGGNGQMMHNKFALLNGVRVFSGAGHYTKAAMNNNWENFALTEVPELNKKYAQYFKELWNVSVDEKYVRAQLEFPENVSDPKFKHKQPTIIVGKALNEDFLKLADQQP
jgi:hypothetical protein